MTTAEMAKIIGVSRITLSKVINGCDGVALSTQEKVRKYIEEYNFEPNSQARSLVGKKEQIIGLFSTYSEKSSGAGDIASHFATEMTNLVINDAQKRNYKTLVALTETGQEFEAVERFINSGLVRGAILLGYPTGSPLIKRLAKRGCPLVLVNQETSSLSKNVAVVNMDDKSKAFAAIEMFVKKGHKRILYLGCNRLRLPAIRRREGVDEAVAKYAQNIESFIQLDGDFGEEKAYNLVYNLYSKAGQPKPTAIFAANDIMAIGAMNALKALNIKIPQEVSVIGFDDISISKYLTPALSTMRCDFPQMASVCVSTLIDMIEETPVDLHIELPVSFIHRATFDNAP